MKRKYSLHFTFRFLNLFSFLCSVFFIEFEVEVRGTRIWQSDSWNLWRSSIFAGDVTPTFPHFFFLFVGNRWAFLAHHSPIPDKIEELEAEEVEEEEQEKKSKVIIPKFERVAWRDLPPKSSTPTPCCSSLLPSWTSCRYVTLPSSSFLLMKPTFVAYVSRWSSLCSHRERGKERRDCRSRWEFHLISFHTRTKQEKEKKKEVEYRRGGEERMVESRRSRLCPITLAMPRVGNKALCVHFVHQVLAPGGQVCPTHTSCFPSCPFYWRRVVWTRLLFFRSDVSLRLTGGGRWCWWRRKEGRKGICLMFLVVLIVETFCLNRHELAESFSLVYFRNSFKASSALHHSVVLRSNIFLLFFWSGK